jgi:hypothetical protein
LSAVSKHMVLAVRIQPQLLLALRTGSRWKKPSAERRNS